MTQNTPARLEAANERQSASPFKRRTLILGHGIYLEEWARWLEAAREAGLNSVFFHTIPGPMALGAAPENLYLSIRSQAVPEARRLGMSVEWGGHHLSSLVPRTLFGSRPALFRQTEGRRKPDANFCISNPETLEVLREGARRLFRERPEVDVFHIWADDLPGGGWCSCRDCAGLSPSEQYFKAFDVLSETLEKERPGARLSFLAYHDTETLPGGARFRPSAELLWAPRPRCYAHGIGDPACSTNNPAYGARFRSEAEEFRAMGGQGVAVFEYWMDGILFKSTIPPLPSTLSEDLRFYAEAGADSVGILLTGDRPLPAPGPNLQLFGRLAEDPSRDPARELAALGAQSWGPEAAESMARYWSLLESAWRPALDREPGDTLLFLPASNLAYVSEPMGEPGDPKDASAERLARIVEREWEAYEALEAAKRALGEVRASLAGASSALRASLEAEAAEYELQAAAIEFWFLRARVYQQKAEGLRAETSGYAMLALESARGIEAWGRQNIQSPRAFKNFAFLNFLYRTLPMRAILRANTPGPLRRVFSWMAGAAELAKRARGVRRAWEPRKSPESGQTSA